MNKTLFMILALMILPLNAAFPSNCISINPDDLETHDTTSTPSPLHKKTRSSIPDTPVHNIYRNSIYHKPSHLYSNTNPNTFFQTHEVIIKFKEETQIDLLSEEYLITGVESIDTINREYNITTGKQIQHNIFKFSADNDIDVLAAVKKYKKIGVVRYAEPNYRYHAHLTPNDPGFDLQWNLNNSQDIDIDANEAWDIETGTPEVVIAIIDSGIYYNHEDIHDCIWHNTDEIPENGIDDDNNGFIDDIRGWDFVQNDHDPRDDCGHGTICAGIASAVTNNTIGIAGVSWNSQLMPVKGLNKEGKGYSSDLAHCIFYAVDNDADVISMSWGCYYLSNLLQDAIAYAYSHDVVLVASAGNDNVDSTAYPAGLDEVIAVAATDHNDQKWGNSNYGDWVDIAAPGVDIYSTTRFNNYYIYSGTSVSAPQVAGLAALLLSTHDDLMYPSVSVKSILSYTTDPIDSETYIGTGRINAWTALNQEPFGYELESISHWEDVKKSIDLQGTICGDGLQAFILELGEGEQPGAWTELCYSTSPQSGILTTLDTTQYRDGLHTLRLRVVYDHDSLTQERLIYINNEAEGAYNADIFVSNCYDSSTSGWGVTHFDTIQDGIDETTVGTTVFVYDGIYSEYITISGVLKSIYVVAQSNEWTIIKGGIMVENARRVTIDNFTIRGALTGPLLFMVLTARCTIRNNILVNNQFSESCIRMVASHRNKVIRNHISAVMMYNTIALEISFGRYHIIADNTIKDHASGILVGMFCRKNRIQNNTITENSCGIDFIMFVAGNEIRGNRIIKNDIGLWFDCHAHRNTIVSNEIAYNKADGAVFLLSLDNRIYLNTFYHNGWFGIFFGTNVWLNQVYLNNFAANGLEHTGCHNAEDLEVNLWYSIRQGKGNYWDDYTGEDRDGDGIGDVPYEIPNKKYICNDRFPLMEPLDLNNDLLP